jgi:hypothetical protein
MHASSRGYGRIWREERDNAFQIDLPDKTSGACPAGTISVCRLVNQRAQSRVPDYGKPIFLDVEIA